MKLVAKERRGGDVLQVKPQAAVQRLIELEAWDHIPYGRPLDAPGCDPKGEIERAVREFLSRHKVDCPVASTLHGQNLIVRLLRMPPLEPEKLQTVVRYEARQQIPFELKEVEWRSLDLTGLSGKASVEDGCRHHNEVALIAAKRSLVEEELARFRALGLRSKMLQAQPLALINCLWSCYLRSPRGDGIVGQTVVLDVGARASTIMFTDGDTFWARMIPLGGAHFTKAIGRQCQLTFGAAEELKCSGRLPEEAAKGVEIMMNDLCTEVQRTLAYFKSLNGKVTLSGAVFFGKGLDFAGAKERLAGEVLGVPIVELDPQEVLEGSLVRDATFRANLPALVPALDAAMEQLGIGKFLLNFLRNGKPPVRTIGSAWGIDLGAHALKAMRLARREC